MIKIGNFEFTEEETKPNATASYRNQSMISPYEREVLKQLADKERRSLSEMGRLLIRQGLGLDI